MSFDLPCPWYEASHLQWQVWWQEQWRVQQTWQEEFHDLATVQHLERDQPSTSLRMLPSEQWWIQSLVSWSLLEQILDYLQAC